MDELMDLALRDQERALRVVMAAFSQAAQRVDQLGGGVGWIGPASMAYDLAVAALRAELRSAEQHLGEALRDTVDALSPGATGQSCG